MTDTGADTAAASPDAADAFAVDHILVSDLPSTLGTVDAPERYTVTAIFTRRPYQQEAEALNAPAVAEQLETAGYPEVSVRVADRRLLIANTNLHELRHGLARVIGRILDDIGTSVATTRSSEAKDAAELAARAAERAHNVVVEAGQVDFTARPSLYT